MFSAATPGLLRGEDGLWDPPTPLRPNPPTNLPSEDGPPLPPPQEDNPPDVKNTPPPPPPPSQQIKKRVDCSYVGGTCSIHGPGAKLKWKLAKDWTPANRTREYYYQCDTGMGSRRLSQPSISTAIRKITRKTTMEDTREDANINLSTTSTVGQGERCTTRAGIKSVRT